MGWEKRGNKRYYYRKRRQDGRVVSEYLGTGPHAELAAALDHLQRELRQVEEREWASHRALDAQIDELSDLFHTLANGVLLAVGYRTHKGQWRKKRDA